MSKEQLYEAAVQAGNNAYAPYSGYPVGAAVVGESGTVYSGSNVENLSYGLTVCAERVAIFNAVSHGEKKIQAIAVYTKDGAMPCGACRQVIQEFGTSSTMVYVGREGTILERSLHDLFPEAFVSNL